MRPSRPAGRTAQPAAGEMWLPGDACQGAAQATVKTHLLHIYVKLGVGDRAAAVAEAFNRGLLTPGSRGGNAVGGSGRTAADQPDGGGDEQEREREQPAALDPLERPEPAGRLIARQLRKAVVEEVLCRTHVS